MKRPDGVTLISIYYWFLAALFTLGICGVFVGMFTSIASGERGVVGAIIALVFGLFFTLAAAVATAAVGWGLWNLKSWARMAAIVLAVLQLFGFPIGTVIGALIIWYLWQDPDALGAFGIAKD
jgi:signal transduction histidine kinase